jgi:putative permease
VTAQIDSAVNNTPENSASVSKVFGNNISSSQRRRNFVAMIQRERRLKLAALLMILFSIFGIIFFVKGLLLAFVFAFVISYMLAPFADFFEARGLGRQASVAIPFLLAGVLIALAITLFLPVAARQLEALEQKIPQYQNDFLQMTKGIEDRLGSLSKGNHLPISAMASSWIISKTGDLSASLPGLLSQSLTVLLLAPLFAFFMLLDGRSVGRSILAVVPNHIFEMCLDLHHQINSQLAGFVRARILEGIIVGGVVWLGLLGLGFPYATILAIFAAVMNLIPYLGPIFGAIPAIAIALVSPEGQVVDSHSLSLILVIGVYLLAQLIDVAFIIPLVVAKIVNLHPVTVVISIIIGAQAMGILGMVISIPVASSIKLISQAIFEHILRLKPQTFD